MCALKINGRCQLHTAWCILTPENIWWKQAIEISTYHHVSIFLRYMGGVTDLLLNSFFWPKQGRDQGHDWYYRHAKCNASMLNISSGNNGPNTKRSTDCAENELK